MKISIVIPAYNEEKNIATTIEALLAQDYKDYEIIVVNNASTDKTYEVASKFPVKVVTENRKGLLWARERGRIEAVGDIIANTDADCLPDKTWLSNGSSYFIDEKIAAVSGPYDYYDADWFFRKSSLFFQSAIYPIANMFFQLPFIHRGATIIGGNNFIRASALEKAGGYDTSITFYGEDTDTAKRVSAHGKVKFSPSVVMKTSARRFKAEGKFNLMMKYWYHFFKHILFVKPAKRVVKK
ncbi:MAG: glycosyltransferase family 2 protein [Candidatus Paceibacterota bacterium]|jgi:glycosyltransferase involved in cell wall biosynthesis